MTRILVVDDHAIVRRGIVQLLEGELSPQVVCEEAADGRSALDKAVGGDYAAVLLDISLPDINGIDVLKRLSLEKPRLPVLFLSMHPEEQFAVRALRAGASGYVTKQSAPEELMTALGTVLSGGKYVSASLSQRLVEEIVHPHPSDAPSVESLSDREYLVLRELAAGKSIKEIAAELFLSIKTVSTYRTRLLKKMRMKSNADIVGYAIRNDLVS